MSPQRWYESLLLLGNGRVIRPNAGNLELTVRGEMFRSTHSLLVLAVTRHESRRGHCAHALVCGTAQDDTATHFTVETNPVYAAVVQTRPIGPYLIFVIAQLGQRHN